MALVTDILDSDLEIRDGALKLRRIFYVTEVPGSKQDKLWNALNTGGIPAQGDPHPVIPNVRARDFRVASLVRDPDKYQIEVTYEPPQAGDATDEQTGQTVEVSIDTFQESTVRDVNGEIMKVNYAEGVSGNIGVADVTQIIEFTVERPTVSVRIQRQETSPPKALVLNNRVGTVNSATWSAFPPKTWLFRGASSSQQSAANFRTTYNFLYNENTWRAEGRVNVDGRLPENASIENGIAFFDVYRSFDFNTLGVQW